jgi:hypothetical protein
VAGPVGPQGPAGATGASGSVTVVAPTFAKLTPNAVSASSQTGGWAPSGVLTPGMAQSWMSATDSGNQEWVEFDMLNQVLFTTVFCSFANGRDGINPRLLVSNDQVTWDAAGSFVPANYNAVTAENFRNYTFSVNLNQVYRYVRLVTDPCPYVFYSYVQFFGSA